MMAKGRHEEREHYGGFLNGFQTIEYAKTDYLDQGVQVHPLDRKLLDVVVLWVPGRVPDEPQLQAVEQVVAGQGCNAHVEEHALQHGSRQELQHRRQEERKPYQHMDQEISSALFPLPS